MLCERFDAIASSSYNVCQNVWNAYCDLHYRLATKFSIRLKKVKYRTDTTDRADRYDVFLHGFHLSNQQCIVGEGFLL